MTFATSGTKPASLGGGMKVFELVCFDTEDEAKDQAECWVQRRYEEVAVWKQIGVPKLETKVSWEDSSCVE